MALVARRPSPRVFANAVRSLSDLAWWRRRMALRDAEATRVRLDVPNRFTCAWRR